jgi:hypothetical protein
MFAVIKTFVTDISASTGRNDFIRKLEELGYQYRPDIKDNTTLNQNFREKFEALNHVK